MSEDLNLLEKIDECIAKATHHKTLISFESDVLLIEDADSKLKFIVRVAKNLDKKPKKTERKNNEELKNPFLPPFEEGLFVTSLNGTHNLLLNKFNVVPRHCLVTTNSYKPQGEPLDIPDFVTTLQCLHSLNGLAFYNCGEHSGYSQPHKHIQVVPRKLTPSSDSLPIELLMADLEKDTFAQIPHFVFQHVVYVFPGELLSPADQPTSDDYLETATRLERICKDGLRHLGVDISTNSSHGMVSYNLLFTTQFVLIVLRSNEDAVILHSQNPDSGMSEDGDSIVDASRDVKMDISIPVNALGFSGSLFVKNDDSLRVLTAVGPMKALESVAILNS